MKKSAGILREKGLKVTPQRLEILNAVNLLNHPTCDEVIESVRKNHPHMAAGTVYKTLETFVQKEIIKKVKTEAGVLRYDGIPQQHHHLYSTTDQRIEDYYNEEINLMLSGYFNAHPIKGFHAEEIILQITGRFNDSDTLK